MQHTSVLEPVHQVSTSGQTMAAREPLTWDNSGVLVIASTQRCWRRPRRVAQRASGEEVRARIYRVGMALWHGSTARLDNGEWGVRVNDKGLKLGRGLEVKVATQDDRKWRSFYHVAAAARHAAAFLRGTSVCVATRRPCPPRPRRCRPPPSQAESPSTARRG